MTLVALGLLLGMAGLLWVMVNAIVQADHRTKRQGQREHSIGTGTDSGRGRSSS
jgi:hypothetical protein